MTSEREAPKPQFEVIDGLRIRYMTGGLAQGRAVLLTSPWPESIIAYRAIWSTLAELAPLVAIDLPGFGQSQSRPDVLDARAMGEFIGKAVRVVSLERPHILAHDVGTSAALYKAVDSHSLFSSLVVGGGAIDERLASGVLKDINDSPDTKAYER